MSKTVKGLFGNTDGTDNNTGASGTSAPSLTPLAISQLGASDSSGVVATPEIGITAPADALGSPGPEIGITAPADAMVSPGFEVGIGTPIGDVPSPGDAPAGNDTSSGDAGDSLAGLGTWES